MGSYTMKAVGRKIDWVAVGEKLAAAIPREALHPAVVARATVGGPRERWAVAFSGGADSLAVLLLLWVHWPERRRGLVALHFNHRLRGRESAAEARFCERVCLALGLRLVQGSWKQARHGASEAEAREARMAFFAVELRRRKIGRLWLGHQRDDIAESLLMRIARGSGAGGLAAPRPVQTQPEGREHLRPLLTLDKASIETALRKAGAVWREDSSNAGADYFRNRVRQSVLPALQRAAGRDVRAGAARARELLEEDDAALEQWADKLAVPAGEALDLKTLHQVPRAVVRRVLHRWLAGQPQDGALSRAGFEQLLARVEAGRSTRFSLGVEGFAVIKRTVLRYEAGVTGSKKRTKFYR